MVEHVAPEDWRRSCIFSLAHWKNGLAFKNIDFAERGRPIIKIAELKAGVTSQTARTMADYGPSVSVGLGDMLFSWSGNPDTSIDVFRWKGEDGWLNQHFFKATPCDGVSGKFLFFLLKWLKPKFAEIARNKQTTGLGHVTIQDLKQMFIGAPDAKEQAEIVGVIGPIQDKIDLNRRMNETLEALARAIFKDWFVDFGPARAKAEDRAPYLAPELWDLFPDAQDEEDKPVGWEEEPVYAQAHWVNGAAYRNMHFTDTPDALPVIKIAELKAGVTKNTKSTNTALGDKYRITDGELLFSWSGNPDASIDAFIWVGGSAWLNQHVFAVRENGKRSQPFLYAMLKWLKPEFAEIARNKQTTGLGHVTQQDLKRLLVRIGSAEIMAAFDELMKPIYDRILGNLMEMRVLAQTRDLLIPKLMSGQIRLRDAEAAVKEAA